MKKSFLLKIFHLTNSRSTVFQNLIIFFFFCCYLISAFKYIYFKYYSYLFKVHGARPPVNLTWFNATEAIGPEENDITEIRTKAVSLLKKLFFIFMFYQPFSSFKHFKNSFCTINAIIYKAYIFYFHFHKFILFAFCFVYISITV